MKHNLSENYLMSLTEEKRINEMKEWSSNEWRDYYCPNGTISLDEFFEEVYNKAEKMILEKYGCSYIN